MLRDAIKIDLPARDTWSNFLKQWNKDKRLGHKREVSRLRHFTRKIKHFERKVIPRGAASPKKKNIIG